MSDYGDEQAHADAVLALLYADADLTTYPAPDGGPSTVPPGALPPYVSVHITPFHDDGRNLNTKSTRFIEYIDCHCVGANDIAARAVAKRVRAALLDVKPTVAGRSVYPIRYSPGGGEISTTEPVAETTVTINQRYRLESVPGTETP